MPLAKDFLNELPKPTLNLEEIQSCWYRGGYPEPITDTSNDFYLQWVENYERTYIYRDIASLFPKLNKVAYQRFLTMLCKLSGTVLNKSTIARSLEVSEKSIRGFITIAEGTFLWRSLTSFEKSISKSIVKMPKGHIRDTGLLHSLLRITNNEQLFVDPIVGYSFESFVIEEILKGIQATSLTHWSSHYYRTRGGSEVDLILDGPFGILPIEIEYGISIHPRQLKSLHDFVRNNNLLFGILINQSQQPCWITDTIFQLPATYL